MKREDMALMNWLKTGIKPKGEDVKEYRFMNGGTMIVFHIAPNEKNEYHGKYWEDEVFADDLFAGMWDSWDVLGTWVVSPYTGWKSFPYSKKDAFEVIQYFLEH